MKKNKSFISKIANIAAVLSIGIICGFIIGKKNITFFKKINVWSIGIYTGSSPLSLNLPKNIKNPVLTAKDVTDMKAEFIADPFMVREENKWYMFFEVMNSEMQKGHIGLAMSNDGLRWNYQQIILQEPFHMSYPYVFKWKDEYYMIPETYQAFSIRLYKAVNFPYKWQFVKNLIYGDFRDTAILRYDEKWWIFTADRYVVNDKNYDVLRLYYSEDLTGYWVEHPKSPLAIGNLHVARCAGRVLLFDGKILRYAQDDFVSYGNQIRAFEIMKLNTEDYEEKEVAMSPILKGSGNGWNKDGMHNIDPHQADGNWIASVDGCTSNLVPNNIIKKILAKIMK